MATDHGSLHSWRGPLLCAEPQYGSPHSGHRRDPQAVRKRGQHRVGHGLGQHCGDKLPAEPEHVTPKQGSEAKSTLRMLSE